MYKEMGIETLTQVLQSKMYYFWILIVGSVFLLNCVTTKDIEVQDLNDVESSYGTKTALDAWRRVFRTQQNIFDELDNERFLRTYLRRKCKQRKTTTTTTTSMFQKTMSLLNFLFYEFSFSYEHNYNY